MSKFLLGVFIGIVLTITWFAVMMVETYYQAQNYEEK